MKDLIKILLREGLDNKKAVSVAHLKSLLNNVSNRSAIKFLTQWISRGERDQKMAQNKYGDDFLAVFLSVGKNSEMDMLDKIKSGGINPRQFGPKN